MTATLNDDPETLEAILFWGKENQMTNAPNSPKVEDNPILLSSLEGYTECMKHLYQAGFRIDLLDKDRKMVARCMNRSTASQSVRGWMARAMQVRDGWDDDGEFAIDPVKRYLVFKAYANPHYLSIKLTKSTEHDDLKSFSSLDKSEMESPEKEDPLRQAFSLSSHAKLLADYFPEHAAEYNRIGDACSRYASDILGYCNNSEEVDILLNHRPGSAAVEGEEEEEDKNTNWHMALWQEHKSFVSHAYYQHFTWNRIRGTTFDPYKFFLPRRLLTFPGAVLIFFLYLPVVLLDSVFREGSLLYESPEQFEKRRSQRENHADTVLLEGIEGERNPVQNHELTEKAFWRFFRERLHRPIYRMCVSAFFEAFFLLVLYHALKKPNDGKANFAWDDYITWSFIAFYLIFDVVDLTNRKVDFLSSFWSCYTLFTRIILAAGGVLALIGLRMADHDRRAWLSGNHPLNIGMTLVAYGATMHCLRTVRWFLLHRKVGPVVVCFIRVLKDVIYVFFVFLIIYLSFGIGIWFMYKPFTIRGHGTVADGRGCHPNATYCLSNNAMKDNPGMRGVLSLMFWRVFDGDASNTKIQLNSTQAEFIKADPEDFSLEFSHMAGLSMWAMYQGITAILLINILIALMNSTYLRVWENVDTEWKYHKTFYQVLIVCILFSQQCAPLNLQLISPNYQVQFLDPRANFPAPFRWIYYMAKLIRWIKGKFSVPGRKYEPQTSEQEIYMVLLQKLITTKMHSEAEATENENFKDLRIDVKNIIEDRLKKSKCTHCS